MPSLKEILKHIRDTEPFISDKDTTIRRLDPEEIALFEDMKEALASHALQQHKAHEAEKYANASRIVFWNKMTHSHEQAESAEERGKVLGVRVDELGNYMLVETRSEDVEMPMFEGSPEEEDFGRMLGNIMDTLQQKIDEMRNGEDNEDPESPSF